MSQPAQHNCLPRPPQPCPQCGELIQPPRYCGICGADISPIHICTPRPLPHICGSTPTRGHCLACGDLLPAPRFCPTCGADITPSHHCRAAPVTHVPRPDPVHICPALGLKRCQQCGELLPALLFCETCGMDITPAHVCQPRPQVHVCPPYLTMPRRCSHCGDLLPVPRHCTRCGADITPEHVCPLP